MEDDEIDPELPPSRYLLPSGCKDLIDVLRRSEPTSETLMETDTLLFRFEGFPPITPAVTEHLAKLLPPNYSGPSVVSLPDPITVFALAESLELTQKFVLIAVLMELGRFVSFQHQLDFKTASAVCAIFGVVAEKKA